MIQSENQILEICFVVRDMEAAILHWTSAMGAGPFFVADMELTEEQFYRGQACEQSIRVAFGFSGGLLIELVQPLRDIPSVFKEVLDARGEGYHHVMPRMDFDRGFQRYSSGGYSLALEGSMPTGERIAMFDTRQDNGGFVEIMEISPLIDAQLKAMAEAHRNWDGVTAPQRAMTEAFA